MAAEPRGAAVPGRVLRLLIPWFVLPVLASPLVLLLIEQGAGTALGLDHASFRAVSLDMLTGYFELWTLATLAGFLTMAIALRHERSMP